MQMAINAAVTADSLAKANARNKEILDKIDAQAVMAVARKYLIEDRQTIAILTPVSGQSEMAKNEH